MPAVQTARTAGTYPVVVVLGMHRSGTSLLSNVLHYLGVDMADETDRATDRNPNGYWERPDLFQLQDELLEAIGRPLTNPSHCLPMPPGWWRDKKVLPFRTRLREYLEDHRARDSGWWGFKDPRTCRLLPLWLQVFEQMGITARFVWAVRSPSEAAVSMAAARKADGHPISAAQAEVMWLAYNYDILRYHRVLNPIQVCYDEWFDQPIGVARRLASELGLPDNMTEHEFADCIGSIVRRTFWRNRDSELPAPTPLAGRLYADIVSRRLDGADQDSQKLIDGYVANLDVMFRTIDPFAQLVGELPGLRTQLRETESQVRLLAERDNEAKRLAERNDELSTMSVAVTLHQQRRAEYEAAIAERDQHIQALVNELAKIGDNAEAAAATLRKSEQRVRALEDDLAKTRGEAEAIATALRDSERRIQTLNDEIARARGDAEAVAAALRESERRIQSLEHKLARTKGEAEVANAALRESERRVRALDDELAAKRREAEAAAAALRNSEKRIQTLMEEVASAKRNTTAAMVALRDSHDAELAKLNLELRSLRGIAVKLGESEKQRRELEIACEGYLARIEALKGSSPGRH
jgi:hypothetical protein